MRRGATPTDTSGLGDVLPAANTRWRLPSVDEIDEVAAGSLPSLLAALAALEARIAARLMHPEPEDSLLTAEEVAERLRSTPDWVKHAKLPFRVRVSEGQVRYSARGLAEYVKARTAPGP